MLCWTFSHHLTSLLFFRAGQEVPPIPSDSSDLSYTTPALGLSTALPGKSPMSSSVNCSQSHEPPRHEFPLPLSFYTNLSLKVLFSCEMMEGLNFPLLSNICLLVWTERKLFVMLPWYESALHAVVLEGKRHHKPPQYLSLFFASVRVFDLSETLCVPSLASGSETEKKEEKIPSS